MVAELNAEASRAASGVVRASRAEKAPRLLVIEVGGRWYQRPEEARRGSATAWRAMWRKAVRNGVVSILDASTGEPAVHFRPAGVEVAPGPPTPPPARPTPGS